MNKTAAALTCALLILNVQPTLAQDTPPLGKSHFTGEMDIMILKPPTDDTDYGGGYLGLAGYGHMGKSWYLGGEIGAGTAFSYLISEDSTYMPLELNAKRAYALGGHWAVDVGGGLSYNRVSFSHDSWFTDDDREVTDWVFGVQLMSDFYFKAGKFLMGLKLKYQFTEDLQEVASKISPDEGWDYSNFKIGLQMGFLIP